MKNSSMISFLTTLLLATALCAHGHELVKDTEGNPLRVGQQYFIQVANTKQNEGNGLVPAAAGLQICPLVITRATLPYQPGLPVKFLIPKGTTNTYIETSYTTVNIEFQSDIWPFCNDFDNSKLWSVADSSVKEPSIVIGGKEGSPKSAFQIEKYGEGNTYKLTTSDGTVGTTKGFWSEQLILTNDEAKALSVKFKKVDDVTAATTSTYQIQKLRLKMFPFY